MQIAQITLFHTFFDPLNMSTENYPPNLHSQAGWGVLFQYGQMTAQRPSYGCTTRGEHVHNS